HTERFLLVDVQFVEHAHVNDDLAWFTARRRLETNPQPAVRFVVLLETSGRDRVGENKKRAFVANLCLQTLQYKVVLVIEHRIQEHPTHVAIVWSVDSITERHVVS